MLLLTLRGILSTELLHVPKIWALVIHLNPKPHVRATAKLWTAVICRNSARLIRRPSCEVRRWVPGLTTAQNMDGSWSFTHSTTVLSGPAALLTWVSWTRL